MWSERVSCLVCVPVFGKFYCCCSVPQSCPSLCDPMDCSMPGFPVLHPPELVQTHVHWVGDAIQHLVLCCPLLLLPSVFPNIKVFSNESALHIRWPKYWNFSFCTSPSSEGWFPLELTGLILQSKRLARECPGVSGGSLGWPRPAAGSETHTTAVLGACWPKSFWRRLPLPPLPLP